MPQPVKNHPCDVCQRKSGKADDHPMVHVGYGTLWDAGDGTYVLNPSFHFDCLPAEYRAMIADGEQHANTRATIEAAESGVHGDELRAHIMHLAKQRNDNDVEPVPAGEEATP
jgi:hypothetical protein